MSFDVDISAISSFQNRARVNALNELVAINSVLNTNMIVGRTNCHPKDALTILVLLLNRDLVNGFTLIYNRNDFEYGVIRRKPFTEGLPKLPFFYTRMEKHFTINRKEDLLISFEFEIKVQDLKFEVKHDE